MYKNLILSALIFAFTAFLVSGCSGSLRSTWVNFNSYYNTFYNAQKSYGRGYDRFENQVDRINPERPIRAHRAPVRAGQEHFEDAIERGSDLLIRFPTSKYVDDAVFLIGKSYYFMENFFNAEQKFIELFSISESEDMRQQAVIWRGRVMLDLDRHNEAINYLSAQLDSPELDWGRREKAETELLLAQHLVKTNQWDQAGEILYESLPNLRDRELRARGYFLHGQILEYIGEFEAAYDAFDRVRRNNPYYQLIYFSELKKGKMLRRLGEYEDAHRHFVRMSRNNNNFEYLSEINYEIGRTLQMKGQYADAMRMYREVLYRSYRTPQRETLAQVHYGVAEIYRYNHRDYSLAAAHYDSASRNASDIKRLPMGFDAPEISRAFGDFARLNEQAEKMDSLLYLGNLPPAKFDSVIAVIQKEYREKMEREMRQRDRDSGRIVSVDPEDLQDATESTENGFLFHLNRQLMGQASQQFQALWGGRPLVDDWRRMEAVRTATVAAEEDEELAEEIVYVTEDDFSEFELDLSEIPRTRSAREEMRERLAKTRYEIGNSYFISLNMPDSARSVFRHVIDKHPDSEVAPQAMYSMSELFYTRGDTANARTYAMMVAAKYPETIYAKRLNERFDLGIKLEDIELAPKEQKIQEYYVLLNEVGNGERLENAGRLFDFAESDTLTSYAPRAYLNAANLYIQEAREDTTFTERLNRYNIKVEEVRLEREEFNTWRDSAQVMIADTTISETELAYWAEWADSTFAEPDLRDLFPYKGENWDNARTSLERIRERFPQFERMSRVNTLYAAIELPAEDAPEPEEDDAEIRDDELPEIDESQVYACADIDIQPEIVGGMEAFVNDSGIKERMAQMNVLEAAFEFRITISAEGEPEQVQSLDEEDEFGFQIILRESIEEQMRFEPMIHEGKRISAICEIAIPVNLLEDEE